MATQTVTKKRTQEEINADLAKAGAPVKYVIPTAAGTVSAQPVSTTPIADQPATPATPGTTSGTTAGSQYNGVAWDSAKYNAGIDTSYYDRAISQYQDMAEKNRQKQLGAAEQQRDSALREAYVAKLQNQKQLGEAMARSGIRGGATETSNIRLANQYGQARASANTDYTNAANSINQAIDQNIFDYTSDMQSRAEEYRQNLAQARWQAEREDAATQAQWDREDRLTQEQWAREDQVRQAEWEREDDLRAEDMANTANETYWKGYAASFKTKKGVQKAQKKLKEKYKAGKIDGTTYKLAMGYLNTREGEIENK